MKILNNYELLKIELTNKRLEILSKRISLDEVDIEGDELDLIQGMSIVETTKTLIQRDIDLLNMINIALNKFDIGTYGCCESCEEQIPIKRLQISPYSSLCVFCKEIMEKEQRSLR